MTSSLCVVFRVAAGPKVGFGHLVRCRSLARALDVEPIVSVRGTRRTRRVAASLGWSVVDVPTDAALAALAPAAVVVDDPSGSDAAVWTRRARRLGVPVATVHDLGIGRVSSDLAFEATADPILD